MTKVPARLYKYQQFNDRTLSNLTQASVWFAAPATFNDPFDCALSVVPQGRISDAELQPALDHVREQLPEVAARMCPDGVPTPLFRETFLGSARRSFAEQIKLHREQRGVACFSEHYDDIMMWSHYADGHRGFCLEFDTTLGEPFAKTKQVVYRDTFPHINPVDLLFDDRDPKGDELFEAMVLTKARCWSYEREWRAMHKEANKLFGYGYRALTGLYFGAQMPDAHKDILSLVLRDRPTQLHIMERADHGFRLVARAVTYTPFDFKAAN